MTPFTPGWSVNGTATSRTIAGPGISTTLEASPAAALAEMIKRLAAIHATTARAEQAQAEGEGRA